MKRPASQDAPRRRPAGLAASRRRPRSRSFGTAMAVKKELDDDGDQDASNEEPPENDDGSQHSDDAEGKNEGCNEEAEEEEEEEESDDAGEDCGEDEEDTEGEESEEEEEDDEEAVDGCIDCLEPLLPGEERYKKERKHKKCGATAAAMFYTVIQKSKKFYDQLVKIKKEKPKEFAKMLKKYMNKNSKTVRLSKQQRASLIGELEVMERVQTMRREEGSCMMTLIEYCDDRKRRKRWSESKAKAQFKKIVQTKSSYCEKNADKEWTVAVAMPAQLKSMDDIRMSSKLEGKKGSGVHSIENMKRMGGTIKGFSTFKGTSKKIAKMLAIDDTDEKSGSADEVSDDICIGSIDKGSDDDSSSPPRRKRKETRVMRRGLTELYSQSVYY